LNTLLLKTRPGTLGYSKGKERAIEILKSAREVFIRDGYAKLTMKKIAEHTGIAVGNLNYYYPDKQSLIADMLNWIIDDHIKAFEEIKLNVGDSPEAQLTAIVHYLVADCGKIESSGFFPELWALSNHDPAAEIRMDELYRKARMVLNDLVIQLNPKLSTQCREQLALFISASIEGLVPFVGSGKRFNSDIPAMQNIAGLSFVSLVKNITEEDIKQF
jgi:AcrR family transcriptional regulator